MDSDEKLLKDIADNIYSLGVYNIKCPCPQDFKYAIRRVLKRLQESEDRLNGIPKFRTR